MLKLTDTHIRILKLFLKYVNTEQGISTYSIGKFQFSRRTFEINRNYLLENKIIHIVNTVEAGKQKREYYDLTPLGFFNLLPNLSIKELKKEIRTKRFSDFAPHISKHWKKIIEFHHGQEDMILEVLKFSIEQIELTKTPHHSDGFDANSSFELSTTINRGYSISLTLTQYFTNWTESDLKEWEEINSNLFLGIKLEKEETIQENIMNQLSFLFCFNIIRLFRDNLLYKIYHIASKPKKHFDDFDERINDYNNNVYNKMIKNNPTQKTMDVLQQDKKLMKIINNNVKKWNKKLEINHPFKDIFIKINP